jgi:hypothetical protein
VKEPRVVDNGGVFSFCGKAWRITGDNAPAKAKIEVVLSPIKGMIALYKGKVFAVLPFAKPKRVSQSKAAAPTVHTPLEDHPWRIGTPRIPLYSSDLADAEIHRMLQDIFLAKYS